MWEDVFQVYYRVNDFVELLASDMSIQDACTFVEAWFGKHFMEQESSLEIKRQAVDYVPKRTEHNMEG